MNKINNRPLFSQNLIKLRKERGLSQEELAGRTGLSKRMIAYYETEAVKPPIDKIETIANVLNVGINDLLESKKPNKIQSEFIQIDGRTLKKLKRILSLSPEDRHLVYSFVDSLIIKKTRKESNDRHLVD